MAEPRVQTNLVFKRIFGAPALGRGCTDPRPSSAAWPTAAATPRAAPCDLGTASFGVFHAGKSRGSGNGRILAERVLGGREGGREGGRQAGREGGREAGKDGMGGEKGAPAFAVLWGAFGCFPIGLSIQHNTLKTTDHDQRHSPGS